VSFGRHLALTGELGPRHDRAVEPRCDGLRIEGEEQLGRAFLAQIDRRGQLEAEIDSFSLPIEITVSCEWIRKRGHAHIRVDMLDALLSALFVVDDVDRAVLDAQIVERHVALGLVLRFRDLAGILRPGLLHLDRLLRGAEADRYNPRP